MVRVLTDFDFNGRIVRGVLRRHPGFDLVRAQDVGLAQDTPDPDVLAWAAANDRIVLTHDRNTMSGFARARVAASLPMPGLFVTDDRAPIGQLVDDLISLDGASEHAEWANRVEFLPL